jgi:MFS transporter, CP family, cyanate transporter
VLHQWSGGWEAVSVLFVSVCLAAALFGMTAGRNRHVGAVVNQVS